MHYLIITKMTNVNTMNVRQMNTIIYIMDMDPTKNALYG